MHRPKTLFVAGAFVLVGIVLSLVVSSNLILCAKGHAADVAVSPESISLLSRANLAMAEVVSAVRPSVVNIASSKTVSRKAHSPFENDPFFRRFFGDEHRFLEKPRDHKQSGLGSGVIVREDGYILTNNHVVSGADEIKVTLSDKREFKGKVIGLDPKTDLAVIKIDSDKLPALELGDSDALKAGEMVFAVGNPFGLTQTVTTGIVSATGRANVGIADYEDFIQTDAPINPGNSGGALVDIRGKLIGINTAIFSTTGGYQGIGFAIPSNMAKVVMEGLIREGKVIRGWLGVTIQSLTPDLSKQFDLTGERGVLVADVTEDGPAEKAGLQRGDVIVKFDGKEVEDGRTLRNLVANTLPGSRVKIDLVRNGEQRKVEVTISELSAGVQAPAKTFESLLRGVQVQNLSPDVMRDLSVPRRVSGVMITEIENGSPAEGVLMKHDVIMEINKRRVKDTAEYEAVVSRIKADQNILLLVFRKGGAFFVTLSAR